MIICKNKDIDRVSDWKDDTIHILTDFDRTITVGNSDSSWSILSKSELVPKEYVAKRQELFNKYRPIEIDESISYETKSKMMTEWWSKHIGLFVEYKLSEKVINKVANDLRDMSFREGAKEFLENMKSRNIPIIIISAGIGNFIEQFLIQNECNFENIYIISNFIKFNNEVAIGVSENIIHSLNKNEVSIPENVKKIIKNRPNIILLGDSISDTRMAKDEDRKNAFKIGFLEEKIDENISYFEEQFDIVCTENTSYIDLFKSIPILKK